MMEWQPIETAPKNAELLLFGTMDADSVMVRRDGPHIFSGYWCELDEAWCANGSHWDGPFYTPTHWMLLPKPPGSM